MLLIISDPKLSLTDFQTSWTQEIICINPPEIFIFSAAHLTAISALDEIVCDTLLEAFVTIFLHSVNLIIIIIMQY